MDFLIGQKPVAKPASRPLDGSGALPPPSSADSMIMDGDQTNFMREVIEA